ncbi:hypothetical protein XFF6990_200167 [Xanthomonas citri pv. fuscans]|nr:hypothetical protein XFF6990_200167 [Xanthomonas citri pv. fuscans]
MGIRNSSTATSALQQTAVTNPESRIPNPCRATARLRTGQPHRFSYTRRLTLTTPLHES